MSTEIVALDALERMAKHAVDSGLFGMKNLPQAVSLMLLCQAKGMHPMQAVEEFHLIPNGRHTMKAERMLAKFQAAGGKVVWNALDDQRAVATFSHPLGGSVTIDWDIERAKRAGLAGKDNWRGYARAMLRSRVVSEGVRTVLPGVTHGTYTPEEVADMPPPAAERDVTPAPERPAAGVEGLKQRLGLTAPAVDTETGEILQPATIDQVLDAIGHADGEDALNAAVDLARTLPEADKAAARKAYGERMRALEA